MGTNVTPGAEAVGYCRECGRPLTSGTVREVQGVLYCEECLAARLAAGPQATPVANAPNPGLAGVIGIIPGLGAVYNGEYVKALLHILIFGGIISLLDSSRAPEGLLVPMLIGFIIYMPIEAYRTAKARAMGKMPSGPLSNEQTSQPIGAIILIGLGGLLLLHRFIGFSIGRLFEIGFPLALVALGVWLLYRRNQQPGR